MIKYAFAMSVVVLIPMVYAIIVARPGQHLLVAGAFVAEVLLLMLLARGMK